VREELELARLVAALGEPCEVVALDGQIEPERLPEAGQPLDRRGQGGEADATRQRATHRCQPTGSVGAVAPKKTGPGWQSGPVVWSEVARAYRQACAQYPGTH
jgi:hypothetical protein